MALVSATANPSAQLNVQSYKKLLLIANKLLILSILVMLLSIAMSFIFPEYFSISIQVIAHIITIVFAGVLKLAYVFRCVGRKALGQEV